MKHIRGQRDEAQRARLDRLDRARVAAPPFRLTPDELELLRLHAALAFHPEDAPYLIPLIYGQLELVTPGAVL